jgi:hypothetical protein
MSLFNYNKLQYNQQQLNVPTNTLATIDTNYPIALQEISNKPMSIIQEPDTIYEDTISYINICSAYRDPVQYQLQYDFRIDLGSDKFKNVKKIEFIGGILPNSAGITSEPYLVLDLGKLNSMEFPMKNNNHKGFSIMTLKNPNQGLGNGGFVLVELGTCFHVATEYKVPVSFNHLEVKIRDMYGNIYNFGDTAGTGSIAKGDQITFTLKITSREVCRKPLGLRNTF